MDMKILCYSQLDNKKKTNNYLKKLYNITKELEKDYPQHYTWFFDKFINGLNNGTREIVFCEIDNLPVAVTFLKKTKEEKKICTIFVKEEYRKCGIGTKILEHSFEFLQTSKPLISMPLHKEKCFQKVINKYKWEKKQVIESYYSDNIELVFNGSLT